MTQPSQDIRFTLLVPTMDRPEWLARCLDSLLQQDIDWEQAEVLVTDDSRESATRVLVRDKYPKVRYNKGPGRGLAANRNSGIDAARGDWIFITDDDCIARPGWAAAFIEATRAFPETRLFEGRTTAGREKQRLDEEAPVNENGGHFWGCNIALSKKTVLACGGFCEEFRFYGYEEVDFLIKAQKAGYEPRFIPGALIYHPWRPARSPRKLFTTLHSLRQLLLNHPEQWRYYGFWLRLKMALSKSLEVLRDLIRFRGRGWRFGLATIAFYFAIPFYLHLRTKKNAGDDS